MTIAKPANCPQCKKPVAAELKSFPFCCERCRLLDLGNWLDGRYRIASTDERQAEGDSGEGDPEDN